MVIPSLEQFSLACSQNTAGGFRGFQVQIKHSQNKQIGIRRRLFDERRCPGLLLDSNRFGRRGIVPALGGFLAQKHLKTQGFELGLARNSGVRLPDLPYFGLYGPEFNAFGGVSR